MMARLFSLLPAACGARGATAASAACGGFGFALNDAATYDLAPASHEVPSPPRFLVLNSRPLGIIVWDRNTKNRLIGCQAWVGLALVWRIHLREAGRSVALLRSAFNILSGICGAKFSKIFNLVFNHE
jgi:hypothetical protein